MKNLERKKGGITGLYNFYIKKRDFRMIFSVAVCKKKFCRRDSKDDFRGALCPPDGGGAIIARVRERSSCPPRQRRRFWVFTYYEASR